MKIVSHNINGLNAYVKNDKLNKLLSKENADIYCFQEVKCSDEQKIEKLLGKDIIEQYNIYNSINTFKKGYAGVTTLVKKDINVLNTDTVTINNPNISGYSEGRLVICEFEKFILINLYSVNSGGEIKTNDRVLFDTYLVKYIEFLQKIKPVIICGDFNVCSTKYDYWGNYEKALNSGPGLMKFEIALFEGITQHNNLIDGYRHMHGDNRKYSWYANSKRKGAKTPYESKHGWRLDYFLYSASLTDNVKECDILEGWQTVDHSPITLELNI